MDNKERLLEGYKLVWADEFDGDGQPSADRWVFETGEHWANQELQAYTDRPENVFVKDGCLHIYARKEQFGIREYTSARLMTYGKFSFTYGYIEFRAKFPKGAGSWPAIWMMPDSCQKGADWPACGEIDMVEHVGRKENNLLFSLHSYNHNHTRKDTRQYTTFQDVPGVCEEFHDYAVMWTDEYIEFFVDGVSMCRYSKSDDTEDQTAASWPFDQPFYMIVNMAVGGGLGGPVDDRLLPYHLQLDYLRVYQKETEKGFD